MTSVKVLTYFSCHAGLSLTTGKKKKSMVRFLAPFFSMFKTTPHLVRHQHCGPASYRCVMSNQHTQEAVLFRDRLPADPCHIL